MPSIISTNSALRSVLFRCTVWLLSVSSACAGILTTQEQAIADRLKSSARPFIEIDPILTKVARQRAADMANRGYFDHVDPDGHGPNWHVRAAGYQLPEYWGTDAKTNYVESIAAGQTSADEAWSGWMDSAGHRKHLMAESDFYKSETSVGVGYYESPGSEYGSYWVVISAPPQPAAALTVTAPAEGAQISAAQVTVSGKTNSSLTSRVLVRVENAAGAGAFVPAVGTSSWSGTAAGLLPGANVIRIRSVSLTGSIVSEITRNVTYFVPTPLTVTVSGGGSVTAGFAGVSTRGVGLPYTVTAVPSAKSLFDGWSGSSNSKAATVSFTMAPAYALTANFIPNPFLTRRGGYSGLLSGGATGALSVSVSPAGVFTGRVTLNGASFPIAGRLSNRGTALLTLWNGARLWLALDVNGKSGISGSLSGAVTARVRASATYRSTAAYPKAGRYTVTLPAPQGANASLPQGNGYAMVTIAATGAARITGALADGQPISASGNVTNDHQLSVYLPLYAGRGHLSGSVAIRSSEVSDLDGQIHWSKPTLPTRIHPAAVEADLPVVGSRYIQPQAGQPVFRVTPSAQNSALTLTDGNLPAPIVQRVTLDQSNRLTASRQPLASLSATIDPVTGLFSGTFTHPVTKVRSAFRGVIFQKQNAGFGYFLGANASGTAVLAPAAK
jgi:hypothetical protein